MSDSEQWEHEPDCALKDASETDEAVMLVNIGPCPCSPAGAPKEGGGRG